MKKITFFLLISSFPTTIFADVTTSIGFISNYVFRGNEISRSVAYAGAEYTNQGFYLGTWLGDTESSELDLYLGYMGEVTKSIHLGIGLTAYEYLDEEFKDDEQYEANLFAKFGFVGIEYTIGKDADDLLAGKNEKIKYNYIAISFGNEDTGVLIGQREFDDENGFAQSEDKTTFIQYHIQKEFQDFDAGLMIGYSNNKDGLTNDDIRSSYVSIKLTKRFTF